MGGWFFLFDPRNGGSGHRPGFFSSIFRGKILKKCENPLDAESDLAYTEKDKGLRKEMLYCARGEEYESNH